MEWNRAFTEVLTQQYRALVVADDGACFSRNELPSELHLATLLVVDIASQSMAMFKRGSFSGNYPVSTSSRGAGCRTDTGCTPLGWHRVKNKIGEAAPLGSVFIGRQQHGVVDELCSDKEDDLITSRILWLDGIQPGVNLGGDVDSCRGTFISMAPRKNI